MWAVSPANRQKLGRPQSTAHVPPLRTECVLPAIAKVSSSRPRKALTGFPAKAIVDPVNVTTGGSALQDPNRGDIMRGVPKITAYLRVLLDDPNHPTTRTYHWLSAGLLPGSKIGTGWVASKAVIRAHFQMVTNMADGDAP